MSENLMLKWNALLETEKQQCSLMSEAERFAYFLLLQFKSPYSWGKENPLGADCSGAVCLALNMATGLKVRTTADGLYRLFFKNKKPAENDIRAAFFITRTDVKHGEGRARKGTAIHVAGLVGDGVVLNMGMPSAQVRTLDSLRTEYHFRGCNMEVRGLDRKALEKAAREKRELFGLDEELKQYGLY